MHILVTVCCGHIDMTCTEADLERYDREGEEFREEMMPLVF
jgi:hypothetical protein